MTDSHTKFLSEVESALKDKSLRKKISAAAENHQHAFEEGKKQFSQLEIARQRAAFIRWKTIENLDSYLIEFEANFIKNGGKVLWAQDAQEATEEVLKIASQFPGGTIVKSKSMITEEIGLNETLEKNGHEVIETDLGQFIIQQTKDLPSHRIMPVLHKSLPEIVDFYKNHQWSAVTDEEKKLETAEDVVAFTRDLLRKKFNTASVGITGANFIIADPGAISITENEGNAVLTSAMPKIHIVIAGIDKVIPSLSDLDLFLPLLSTFGTGQPLTVYNTIINAPGTSGENRSSSEMYVVLVDNGRTQIMADEIIRESAHCIHCGACMLADPVFRMIGGHAYGNIYNGPYGAAMLPHKDEMKKYVHLSIAHPLDGQGSEHCPVNIDFNKLFLHNRKIAADSQLTGKSEKWFYFFWKKAMLQRNLVKLKGIKTLGYFISSIFNSPAKEFGVPHHPASKSFNEMWQERTGKN